MIQTVKNPVILYCTQTPEQIGADMTECRKIPIQGLAFRIDETMLHDLESRENIRYEITPIGTTLQKNLDETMRICGALGLISAVFIVLNLFVSGFLIRMEYRLRAKEFCIKTVLGYTMLQKFGSFLMLSTLSILVSSIIIVVLHKQIAISPMVLLGICLGMLIADTISIVIYAIRTERSSIVQCLRGSIMIELIGVKKSFGDRVLYQDLNLTINDGEFVVLIGASGCGKTTLLDMIGGIEPLDQGKILVDGLDITKRRNRLIYFQTKLGMLFQNFALIENLTVRKNLELVQKHSRSDVSIEDALCHVGMQDYLDKKVCTLSGGEQQRIALARLMVKKCSIILADEPTGSLDSDNANKVMEILTGLNRMGKTIVMVTHDIQFQKIGSRQIDLMKCRGNN